jgi:7-cyano-7-deazaguanine synthase in queuosine biosynthesis
MILQPSNTVYNIEDHFPPLTTGKAAVALSGGLESTLIAKIALDYYGEDNVVLVYSDNPDGNQNVLINVTNAANMLGKPVHYIDVDTQLHFNDMEASVAQINKTLKELYNVEFTMWGFTKLFFNVAEFKEDDSATHESIIAKCYSEPDKYRDVIEEFHLPSGIFTEYVKDLDIPGIVYKMLRSKVGQTMKRPFDTLNKSEVIDLYRQLGYLDLAQRTHSCVTDTIRDDHTHCGTCFNCQQRHDAFAKLGVEDLTKYKQDYVKASWELLQQKLQELR